MLDGLLKHTLGDKLPAWTALLIEDAGFQPDQAAGFLPAVVERIGELAGEGVLYLAHGFDATQILDAIDLDALGATVGIGADQARVGLRTILPELSATVTEKAGEVGGLLDALKGAGGSEALRGLADLRGPK